MAFESLTDKLQNVFKKLRSKGRLTEEDVKIALKEVKMALLEADVNFRGRETVHEICTGTCSWTGRYERTEPRPDGHQDCKRRAG